MLPAILLVFAAPAPMPKEHRHIIIDVPYMINLGSISWKVVFHKNGTLSSWENPDYQTHYGGWSYDKKMRILRMWEKHVGSISNDYVQYSVHFTGSGMEGYLQNTHLPISLIPK